MTVRRTTSTPNEMTESDPVVTAYPSAAAPLRAGAVPARPGDQRARDTHAHEDPLLGVALQIETRGEEQDNRGDREQWQYDEADEDASQRSHYRTIARASGTRHSRA